METLSKLAWNIARKRSAVFLFMSVFAVTLTGCLEPKPPLSYQTTDVVLGTAVTVTAYGDNAQKAVPLAQAEFKRIDGLTNRLSSTSEVTNVNRAAGTGPARVSPDTMYVVKRGLYYSELTGGAYDITVAPLDDIWGIGLASRSVPSESAIKSARARVDYRLVQMNEADQTVYLPKAGMGLDLSTVSRGYAVDKAISVLKQNGITSGSVTVDSITYSFGAKPDGPWKALVPNPRATTQFIATMPIDNLGAATIADYQNVIEYKGMPYHSNLDPATGKPAKSGLTSVTVISSSCADASVLSHSVFVLGETKGGALLTKVSGADAIFVEDGGVVTTTPGISAKVERAK